MIEEYINLIFHLTDFKNKYPEYTEKINKALEAIGVEQWMIKAVEAELKTGEVD